VDTPVLAFEQVSKRYRTGVLALDHVSWTVQAGTRTCLLGPNGAGKSTAIRLLQGALRPSTGQVTLLGAAVNGPRYLEARRRTGIVPQNPGMYSDLTTAEFLRLTQRLYGRGEVVGVVGTLGLEPYLETRLDQLSGGFRRRVVLAAALLSGPEILLLDEPTAGLDPVAANDVQRLLQQVMLGRTTLLCTHNLTEAEALCDQVVILRQGRVLVQESLEHLRRRAHSRLRLAARQGAAPLLAALQLRGLEAIATGSDGGVLVELADVRADAPSLLRALLQAGLDIYECRPMQASLEALFLEIVRGAA
jgi:ABC-2 type transport system ATP-binding protein